MRSAEGRVLPPLRGAKATEQAFREAAPNCRWLHVATHGFFAPETAGSALGGVGGEGVLGLQRAFQVAGAKTTVTSLWAVPDLATQLLMQRFYENLWGKNMPKLPALREAQIWLMKEGGNRGLKIEGKEKPARLPPYYWAGWVLAGDWR